METPSNSGWMCDMSMLSAGLSLIVFSWWPLGGDWIPKSDDLSSLLVTRIALSLAVVIESTRISSASDGSNVRLGFLGAGA